MTHIRSEIDRRNAVYSFRRSVVSRHTAFYLASREGRILDFGATLIFLVLQSLQP